MKHVLGFVVLAALGGCAVDQPQRNQYGNNAYAQPRDPAQWRVVSVTPVPPGTAARVASSSKDGKAVEYSTGPAPVSNAYRPAPVYAPNTVYGQSGYYPHAPVYAPGGYYPHTPIYRQEPAYYWPPVTLSLGFVFGRHWSRGHHGGRYRHR